MFFLQLFQYYFVMVTSISDCTHTENEKFSMAERVGSIPVHSSSFSELVGVCVIVSGDIIGYLYSLWPQNCLLTEYRYTMAAIQVGLMGMCKTFLI